MEQDNERDYLGRPYTAGSRETEPPGQYGPASLAPPSEDALPGTAYPAQAAGTAPAERENSGGSPGSSTAPDTAPPAEPHRQPGRRIQVGTVVWGLVLTVLSVLLLLVNTVNLRVDPVLLLLCLTLGAGLALLAGGFISAVHRNRSR